MIALYVTIKKLLYILVPRVSLIGLHCCGDLTPTLLSLMTTPPHTSLTSAVIVPCCYHKMSAINEQTITNFPLSQYYKREMSSCNVMSFNTFALRLAAQEPLVKYVIQLILQLNLFGTCAITYVCMYVH